jgi:hypothetical protein
MSPVPRSYSFELPVADFLERQDAIFHTAAQAVVCVDKEIYRPYALLLIDRMLPIGQVGDARWRLLGIHGSAIRVFLELAITWIHGWHPRCRIVLNTVLPACSVGPLVTLISQEQEEHKPSPQDLQSERTSLAKVIALGVGQPVTFVEQSPVVAMPTMRGGACHRTGEQLLVLKPSRFWGLVSLPFMLLIVFLAGLTVILPLFAVREAINSGPLTGLWRIGVIGLIMLFFFAFSLFLALSLGVGRRFEFDKDAGWIRRCWDVAGYGIGMRQVCPLREVIVVQLLEVRRHSRRPRTYQLNLVLDNIRPRRINVSERINLELTRQTGFELAAFLGIPLLDEPIGSDRP